MINKSIFVGKGEKKGGEKIREEDVEAKENGRFSLTYLERNSDEVTKRQQFVLISLNTALIQPPLFCAPLKRTETAY